MRKLIAEFAVKGKEFENVLKMGRTQLQDAVPMTLGQVRPWVAGLHAAPSAPPQLDIHGCLR